MPATRCSAICEGPVAAEEPQRRPSFRARTVLARDKGVIVAAHIFLYPSPDAVELIAHEIEHVLEQLDGVDLEAHVGSGNVWKREDGAFETRRATEAGRRVAREVGLNERTRTRARGDIVSASILLLTDRDGARGLARR